MPRRCRFLEGVALGAVLLALVFALASCGGNLPPDWTDYALCLAQCTDGTCEKTDSGTWTCVPDTPPTPTPCTPGSCPRDEADPRACVDGACVPCAPDLSAVPWSHESPAPSCSTPARPLKHWPPTAECPIPTDPCVEPPPPSPQCPTFVNRGGFLDVMGDSCDCYVGDVWTPCPPPEPGDCCQPDPEGPGWGTAYTPGQRPTHYLAEYRRALAAVGDRCGTPPRETLALIAAELERLGVCADGPWVDAVSIRRDGAGEWYAAHPNVPPDGLFEEWHAVFYGNGCTIDGNNAHKATWEYLGDECGGTTPPPGEVVCVDPELTGIRHRIKMHCPGGDPSRKWCDATPSVGGCEFCSDIGLPCMPGTGPEPPCTPRCDCPPRTEGHPERHDCESVFFGWNAGTPGDPLWRSDGAVHVKPDNRALAYCSACTWIEVCELDGTNCTRAGG